MRSQASLRDWPLPSPSVRFRRRRFGGTICSHFGLVAPTRRATRVHDARPLLIHRAVPPRLSRASSRAIPAARTPSLPRARLATPPPFFAINARSSARGFPPRRGDPHPDPSSIPTPTLHRYPPRPFISRPTPRLPPRSDHHPRSPRDREHRRGMPAHAPLPRRGSRGQAQVVVRAAPRRTLDGKIEASTTKQRRTGVRRPRRPSRGAPRDLPVALRRARARRAQLHVQVFFPDEHRRTRGSSPRQAHPRADGIEPRAREKKETFARLLNFADAADVAMRTSAGLSLGGVPHRRVGRRCGGAREKMDAAPHGREGLRAQTRNRRRRG